MQTPIEPPVAPDKVTGVKHIFAATRYSAAGFLRLWGETAFRHELLAASGLLIVLGVIGAPALAILSVAILSLVTLAVEALNTAVEELVDHVSPEWSLPAKHAKDMGSFAVMALLFATGLAFAAGVWAALSI
ncbi:diacylglycerol kinase [Lentibacter sp. XHP0401]|jgi:diacylglycerol kinase (ATP)|uniref:diacylglycerol kinase n=1 Tax=Lentibacter sp. XHP0401 TaxID=2984334 RepID=UPI0021E91905|nr:diacylglycerol kinase [Lentibacter sp. XHP0401]MCV2893220.1 diacylglycerol kinase [Lentibacter sp. XHP0401]